MTKRIYNEHGAHNDDVRKDLDMIASDIHVTSAYNKLIAAGYESRDAETYLHEVLSCHAACDRVKKGLEFSRKRRLEQQEKK